MPSPIEPIPNEDARLAHFWGELGQVEDQLIARNAFVQDLIIEDYVAYTGNLKLLTLDLDMTAQDITRYFVLFDRLTALQNKTGVSIDLGVQLDQLDQPNWDAFTAKIGFFELNLSSLSPAVKTLELDSYDAYFLEDRQLTLNADTYEASFVKYKQTLVPSLPFFTLLDRLGLSITTTDTDYDDYAAEFVKMGQAVVAAQTQLTRLVSAGGLASVSFYKDNSSVTYFAGSHEMVLPTVDPGLTLLPNILSALASQAEFSKTTGISIDPGTESLDQNFLTASDHFSQVTKDIAAKASVIQDINFGETSSIMGPTLTVGYQDSVVALRAIIAQAH
jgi:hypothetical protein